MDQDFFISVLWIIFFVWIYKKIKNRKKRNPYSETESLDIKRRLSEAQSIRSNHTAKWSTDTGISNNEMHGHRCYIDDLTSYEYLLVKHLAEHLDPKEYYIFNNITIPSSVTVTTQIDHIIVSKYGIFVIENKDYSGWIFGHKNQKKWTQTLWGKKSHFQNPILQNFAHVSALKEHMPFLKKSFYSVIVFSEESEFKTEMPPSVMHGDDLVDYIESKKKEIVSEGELLMAIGKLSVLCQTQVTAEQHAENLEVIHSGEGLTPIPLSTQTGVTASTTK
tara:strand:- start:64 stop:894 length:831 start_codon:yes stop_codon:yes gene_type:complete